MKQLLYKIIRKLTYSGVFNWMSDEPYLKLIFPAHTGYALNLREPKTFNEKLQWLKLHDRKVAYSDLVDKYEVKRIVGDLIGEKYIIPTLGVWDCFDDIDFNSLPKCFVLKCTHDSGGLVVCKDKDKLDINSARQKIEASLKQNYYYTTREWPYKDVKPRIIAEEFIGDISSVPEDYKFYTFDGKIDSVMVCKERELGYPKFLFYDLEWNRLQYQREEPVYEKEESKPKNFEEMCRIVEKLADGFCQMRVDLYNIDGKIYFGEMTFFNQSGFDVDITRETDLYWGNKIVLPKK